jgi:hypothetical protein
VRNGISLWITVLCAASTVRGSAMQYGGAEQSTDFAGFLALARVPGNVGYSVEKKATDAVPSTGSGQALSEKSLP